MNNVIKTLDEHMRRLKQEKGPLYAATVEFMATIKMFGMTHLSQHQIEQLASFVAKYVEAVDAETAATHSVEQVFDDVDRLIADILRDMSV